MRVKQSLDDLLGDFNPTAPASSSDLKSGGPVTIWFSAEYKTKYDNLQKSSGRRFCKKAREVLMELIDLAEKRAS